LQTILGGGQTVRGGGVDPSVLKPFVHDKHFIPKELIKDKEFHKEHHKEKPEIWEIKVHKEIIKPELDLVKATEGPIVDPGPLEHSPVINQLAQAMTGLQAQVGQLMNEVSQLRAKMERD
jgi:hypothetical protein